jgi:tRNA-intron endonuclease
VLDAAEAKALFADGWVGRDVGIGLQISLPEAAYLAAAGKLDVRDAATGEALDAAALSARAERVEPDFALRRETYARLRRRGIVPKTGFKYGTHFRAYVGAPEEEHAPYLVHALPPDRLVAWPEVAGFVRLAHGVRKRLFFAVQVGDDLALLELARRKP